MAARRKQGPGHVSGDAKLDYALDQLADVLTEIARNPLDAHSSREKATECEANKQSNAQQSRRKEGA